MENGNTIPFRSPTSSNTAAFQPPGEPTPFVPQRTRLALFSPWRRPCVDYYHRKRLSSCGSWASLQQPGQERLCQVAMPKMSAAREISWEGCESPQPNPHILRSNTGHADSGVTDPGTCILSTSGIRLPLLLPPPPQTQPWVGRVVCDEGFLS
jgi:hypothetical protein